MIFQVDQTEAFGCHCLFRGLENSFIFVTLFVYCTYLARKDIKSEVEARDKFVHIQPARCPSVVTRCPLSRLKLTNAKVYRSTA